MSLRLTKSDLSPDYSRTLSKSDFSYSTDDLLIKGKYNSLSRPRLGYSIPKSGTKKAHRRNNLKRIIREPFRLRVEHLPKMDFIVIITKDKPELSLKRCIEEGFEKSKIPLSRKLLQ